MMMRFGVAALALFGLAACSDAKVEVRGDNGEKVVVNGAGGGYTLQVVGDDGAQVYIVSAPDGRTAAGKVEGEVSTLLGPAEAQNMVTQQQALMAADSAARGDGKGDDVNISVPGFSLQVSGDESNGDRGKVRMKAAGFDLDVNADDDGTGNERAVVRIGGVDADSARQFINDTDGLSEETKAQMREKLGL